MPVSGCRHSLFRHIAVLPPLAATEHANKQEFRATVQLYFLYEVSIRRQPSDDRCSERAIEANNQPAHQSRLDPRNALARAGRRGRGGSRSPALFRLSRARSHADERYYVHHADQERRREGVPPSAPLDGAFPRCVDRRLHLQRRPR